MARLDSDLPAIDAFVRSLRGGDGDEIRASSGAAAALSVALAADLVTQVAHGSPEWDERGGALAQADAIRDRAIDLAAAVGRGYSLALSMLAQTLAEPAAAHAPGSADLGEVLGRVLEQLLQICETATDAAELAALVARSGTSRMRADAVAATMLATAAAEISAHLVEVNLLVTGDDARVQRARELVTNAAASRHAARTLGR